MTSPNLKISATGDLPSWADNKAGHALIAAIAAEQPDTRVEWGSEYRASWERIEQYRGKSAKALRDLYNLWYDSRIDLCSTVAHGSADYHALRDETLAVEQPDALISRILREAQGVIDRGDNTYRVAA